MPYIQILINNLDRKAMKRLVFVLFFLFSIVSMVPKTKVYYNELLMFIAIYLLGTYIKKYKIEVTSNKKLILAILVEILVIFLSVVIINIISNKMNMFKEYLYYFCSLNSPLTVLLGLTIFLLFQNIDIGTNIYINKIASTTFGIYLIHDNMFLKQIIWLKLINANRFYNIKLIFISILGIFLVFFICALIDYFIENTILLKVNNKIDVLCEKKKMIINEGENIK